MAFRNRLFNFCSNPSAQLYAVVNDQVFVPGQVIRLGTGCWTDGGSWDVTNTQPQLFFPSTPYFNNCTDCNSSGRVRVKFVQCNGTAIREGFIESSTFPTGVVAFFNGTGDDNLCYSANSISTNTSANDTLSYTSFNSCVACNEYAASQTVVYTATTFINCCNASDVKTFNVKVSDLSEYPTPVYRYSGSCYQYYPSGTIGTIQGYLSGLYSNCQSCYNGGGEVTAIACPTPTPTPTTSPTMTPTPSITPSNTRRPNTTPSNTPTTTNTLSATGTRPLRPSIISDCKVNNIVDLTVSCSGTSASSSTTPDGTITLTIYGGTAPYTTTWSDGGTGTYRVGLTPGDYVATTVDYYGDYTAVTTCTIISLTPTPTVTPTPTITPSMTPVVVPTICLTLQSDAITSAVTFNSNYFVNGRQSWSAATAGGTWNIIWSGTRWDLVQNTYLSTQIYSTSTSIVPTSGWIVGGYPIFSTAVVVTGTCTASTPTVSVNITDDTCYATSSTHYGAILVIGNGGTQPYLYSVNGGLTYQASPYFSGLSNGTYQVRLKDDDNNVVSTTAVVGSQPLTTYELTARLDSQQNNFPPIGPGNSFVQQGSGYRKYTVLGTDQIPVGATIPVGLTIQKSFTYQNVQTGFAYTFNVTPVVKVNGVAQTITTDPTTNFPMPSYCNLTNREFKGDLTYIRSSFNIQKDDVVTIEYNANYNATITRDGYISTTCRNNINVNVNVDVRFTQRRIIDCKVIGMGVVISNPFGAQISNY